ncbi:hypothetical protein BN946_scf184845.g58 [Trametes cinnabarina]|uniref:Uncharacterized protein n=1 Tax=Pycnoporus cinnabarinus TaxID=5643 RepID=A0A060SFL4_PYCCI|nr:hypothetical protein BN946_scf184845.g58 [Trametes cinnabarina]
MSAKATSSPKTPPAGRKLGYQDPDTTPTRNGPSAAYVRQHAETSRLPRRNSWEEEMQVHALPDPRAPEVVSYLEIWKGPYLELSQTAVRDFLGALEAALVRRPADFRRFHNMLRGNAREASVDLEDILEEAVVLFGHHAELVHLFNGMLPPGYRMETHSDYVAVFTPRGGWNALPGGIRVRHPVIPSSSR